MDDKMIRLKESADEHFIKMRYEEAIPIYTKAIGASPDSLRCYERRVQCFMKLNRYKQALQDYKYIVEAGMGTPHVHVQIAKCYLGLGDISAAEEQTRIVLTMEPEHSFIEPTLAKIRLVRKFEEVADKAYAKKNYKEVVEAMDNAVKKISCFVPGRPFILRKAESLVLLGDYMMAEKVARKVSLLDALYIYSLWLWYGQEQSEQAVCVLEFLLRMDPDHMEAAAARKRIETAKLQKEAANKTFGDGRWLEAQSLYSKALDVDPHNRLFNAKLHFNRALSFKRAGKINKTITDCSAAVHLHPSYVKALLLRAKSYLELEDFARAINDYKKVVQLDNCKRHTELLHNAQFAEFENEQKQKNYYELLGVWSGACTEDIFRAYNAKIAELRFCHEMVSSHDEKEHVEKMFMMVHEACRVLSTPHLRMFYDMCTRNDL